MTDLLEWHRKKFPKATPDSQKIHLKQEIKEFEEADESHSIEELADIYIVGMSLYRWSESKKLADGTLNFYFNNFNSEWRDKILKAVDEKINVINSREYFWNGQDYDRKRSR